MSLCINGRWHADACRCFKFWTGRECDRRLCARGAGVLKPDDGLCRCRPGFGGEFCQYEICLHEQKWYCNTTEMAPPTIWDEEGERMRPPQPCEDEVLEKWFKAPEAVTPAWYCHCGAGFREVLTNETELLSPFCTCKGGYRGQFCEKDICSKNGSVWRVENGTCVVPEKVDEYAVGFFGFEINNELAVATLVVFTLIAICLVMAWWYVKKVDREARALDDMDTVARRMSRRYRNKSIGGYSTRHFSITSKAYTSVSTLSPRDSTVSQIPPKRKQGNLPPITPPIGSSFDYRDFYAVGPDYWPTAGDDVELSDRSRSMSKKQSRADTHFLF